MCWYGSSAGVSRLALLRFLPPGLNQALALAWRAVPPSRPRTRVGTNRRDKALQLMYMFQNVKISFDDSYVPCCVVCCVLCVVCCLVSGVCLLIMCCLLSVSLLSVVLFDRYFLLFLFSVVSFLLSAVRCLLSLVSCLVPFVSCLPPPHGFLH